MEVPAGRPGKESGLAGPRRRHSIEVLRGHVALKGVADGDEKLVSEDGGERRRDVQAVLREAEGAFEIVIPEQNLLPQEQDAEVEDMNEVPDEGGALGHREFVRRQSDVIEDEYRWPRLEPGVKEEAELPFFLKEAK